jgi:hypothetical protein
MKKLVFACIAAVLLLCANTVWQHRHKLAVGVVDSPVQLATDASIGWRVMPPLPPQPVNDIQFPIRIPTIYRPPRWS